MRIALSEKILARASSRSISATKTLNLLSIGHRGVGKTVFLVGSYAELHSASQTNRSGQLWFDCRDRTQQEKIDNILNYIAQTGQYPSATMKITDFNFSLKRRSLWGSTKTLCHFSWWDIPGEYCNLRNPDFQKIVLSSHGCCVFINADALVRDRAYLETIEDIIKQVVAIASLVQQHRMKYSFALIFTKFDLLEPGPQSLLQIEENVQPLVSRLNAVKANYQKFYSSIPIVSHAGTTTLKPTGAAAPLLWLLSQLSHLRNLQAQQLGSVLMQSLSPSDGKVAAFKRVPSLNLSLTARKSILILALASMSLLGVSAFAFGLFTSVPEQAQTPEKQIREYELVLQREPTNAEALFNLANLYIQIKQPDQAVPLLEKLVQQQPQRLGLRLNLAELYKLTDQKQKAQAAYDQVLALEKNNLTALVNKALLRSEQGDFKTARTLLVQAEQVAPDANLKAKIREIAKHVPATTE